MYLQIKLTTRFQVNGFFDLFFQRNNKSINIPTTHKEKVINSDQ